MTLHLRAVLLPDEEERDLWVADGHVTFEPVAGAETVATGGWAIPGLVDAHCHIGLGPDAHAVDPEEARIQAEMETEAGALLVRDAGSPVDTRVLDHHDRAPRIIRAGRHLARPKRYSPGLGLEIEPDDLPGAVAEQAKAGDGWVKIVGDWIDRSVGDLTPLWPLAALRAAVESAHANGARVAVHTFGEEALGDLVEAGVDSIEHGTGVTDDIAAVMAERRIALVPTLVNVDNFPGIADAAGKYPVYAERMRRLHASAHQRLRNAWEAGVPVYCGTDAGSIVAHGRVVDEVCALAAAGLPAADALAAGSWAARHWLSRPGLVEGAHGDFIVYDDDPRKDLRMLAHPRRLVLRGNVLR
ncbi:MAG: amidohydrolase family protein [Acidimicrobiia bacterium]